MTPARGWPRGLLYALVLAVAGCGREPAKPESKKPDKDLPSFEEGKGLFLPEETRQSIGLQIAAVGERKLQRRVTVNVQVYRAANGGTCHATGLVNQDQAALLHPGQSVSLTANNGSRLEGTLAKVDMGVLSGSNQAEVIVDMPASAGGPTVGTFLSASLAITNQQSALMVPNSALLRAADGDFVYLVKGDRLLRTAVNVGYNIDDFVQIKQGLHPGDKAVLSPVQLLWLTELRLSRGGGAD